MCNFRHVQRSILTRTLGILLVICAVLGLTPVQARGTGSFVVDQVVVKLDPLANTTIAAINATYGTRTRAFLPRSQGTYLLQVPSGSNAELTAAAMAEDLRLEYAEPNYIGQAPEANPRGIGGWGGTDPAPMTEQYAISMLGLPAAHSLSTGVGTIVAVLDTGVQSDHPALAASLTRVRYDFVDSDAVPEDIFEGNDNDGDGLVDEAAGHGTHVAGIIHLVAPAARIMPLRVLDSDGNGDVFTLARAIDYATLRGARVINLSLGTTARSDVLRDAISAATRQGVIVVAAAGNENSDTEQYPAADNCAVSVTAVGTTSVKSPFANFGKRVDVAAPGESIYSTFPPSGYAWWSGTSMATPFVAGQAALIRQLDPTITAARFASVIGGTAYSLDTLNGRYDGMLGQGRINIGASLRALATGRVPASSGGMISSSCVE
jgi:subtilisin family serine protease